MLGNRATATESLVSTGKEIPPLQGCGQAQDLPPTFD